MGRHKMSKSIFFRRWARVQPNVETVFTWELDQVIPLSSSQKIRAAMFTNGASRISISCSLNSGNMPIGTILNTYVDSISHCLWDDYMGIIKETDSSLFPALSTTLVAPEQIFLQAQCTFETLKVTIELPGPDPEVVIMTILGWNAMGDQ